MRPALLPKHVAAVVRQQKEPRKALEMFNSVGKGDGFEHNLFTYTCMIEKLGCHGDFEAMEDLIVELRLKVEGSSLEGVYVGAMRNYGRKGRVKEAVDVFERMDFHGCEPSVRSYSAIMNVLVESGYHDQAHKVYLRMIDRGIAPDAYTFSVRIKSFCKTGRPHAALRLLRNMPLQGCENNAVAYCTVIGGFYGANFPSEAYALFLEMLGLDICPGVSVFNKLIHTLCKNGDIEESGKLLSYMLKRGMIPNLFTYNIFIQGLCKRSVLSEAVKLLDCVSRESREGIAPDVVTYNTLICGLCKNTLAGEAEKYLHKMVNHGPEPDSFTYNTVIKGYCDQHMVKEASRILDDAVCKGFIPDEFTYCSLIRGFFQDGDVDRAMGLFKEVNKPSVVLYNTVMKALCQKGLVLEALDLMTKMSKDVSPDIWTYNIIIDGLCKLGCLSDASTLLNDAIVRGYLPDIFTFNTLVDGFCKQLKLDSALEIIDSMWGHEVTPDVITYNSLLDGLCKAGKYDDVVETFKEVVEKGCIPNIITYNVVIESLCKGKKVNKARELLHEMVSRSITPDIVSFATLIKGFCDNGDLDGANELFRKAEKQYQVSHTTSTYNIMINAQMQKLNTREAAELFQEMSERGCAPDSFTYHVLITGYCKAGDVHSGHSLLLEEVDKGLTPALSSFGRVLNCLLANNMIREAVGLISLMVRRGIVPEAVNAIFDVSKREVAAPKIVLEDLLKRSYITYSSYELLFDAIRDKKLLKKKFPSTCSPLSKKKSHSTCSQSSKKKSLHPVKAVLS